ncbi:MAG: hypothetical protein II951_01435 [Bacteroidales bacterium]|nr:hypothetical protein [Bacteroidales bacterium]
MSRLTNILTMVIIVATCTLAKAQTLGAYPDGLSDAIAEQLTNDVNTAETTTWKVNYERRTIEKGEVVYRTISKFDNKGNILSIEKKDKDGQTKSLTTYYYEDGKKISSTESSQGGDKVTQTSYTYDDKGRMTEMLLKDYEGTEISRTTIETGSDYTTTREQFRDGETLETTMKYDKNLRLNRVSINDGTSNREMRFKIGPDGLPTKGLVKDSNGEKKQLRFTYEKDTKGNWTKKTVYLDDKVIETSERVINYR